MPNASSGPFSAPLPPLAAESTSDPCGTPGCREKRGHGLWGAFCEPCAANLARIRDEMQQELHGSRANWASVGNGLRTVTRAPTCCTPGCDEPRGRGEVYCAVCRAMGAIDDELTAA